MKLRIRKLANGEWSTEAKRIFRKWQGVYITKGINSKGDGLRFISYAPFGDVGYASFCLFDKYSKALENLNEVKAILGMEFTLTEKSEEMTQIGKRLCAEGYALINLKSPHSICQNLNPNNPNRF